MKEIPEDIGTWIFHVRLDRPRLHGVTTVEFELGPATARPGEDFIATRTMAWFGPGQMLATVPVVIVDNDIADGDRTFLVTLTSAAPDAVIIDPVRTVTIIDDDDAGEATCRFRGQRVYDDGSHAFAGTATIDDNRRQLRLVGERGGRLTVDLSGLSIGGETGTHHTDADGGRYQVELDIEINADPAGVAEWEQMDGAARMAAPTGLPERLAARRLKGQLQARWSGASGSGARTITAAFDAGNGPYHCEGGLDAQEDAVDAVQDFLRASESGR